ncbi:MAG: endonuclease/exonuclease/phosphatase family protein [Bdellovibrionales bacterium]|nr:endonuclease/exonuclease/phosphatase family protein [Bdellovibrionales bacterium]
MKTLTHRFTVLAALLVSFSALAGAEPTAIRVMSANISSGNKQSYDPGEGIRIFQGLHPDVVMIQEFNYGDNSKKTIDAFVASTFGKDFQYFREGEATDQIPNGVISRFPIVESGEWADEMMPNRDFAYARLDIPGKKDLWAISVHLHSKKLDVRAYEATRLADLIQTKIPAGDYVVLGGDFNLTSRTDSIIQTLAPAVSEKAAPTDLDGLTTTNMNKKKNYDWVLTDADLAQYQVPVKFAGTALSFPTGFIFSSETFPNLDAVKPIQKSDSDAPGMQHYPVIKDFAVPAL